MKKNNKTPKSANKKPAGTDLEQEDIRRLEEENGLRNPRREASGPEEERNDEVDEHLREYAGEELQKEGYRESGLDEPEPVRDDELKGRTGGKKIA